MEKSKKETSRLSNRLSADKQGKVFVDGLTQEIESLKQAAVDDAKTVEALKLACSVSIPAKGGGSRDDSEVM